MLRVDVEIAVNSSIGGELRAWRSIESAVPWTATSEPGGVRRDDCVVSPLDELAPGLWRFTVTRSGLPPTMTAYVLRDGARALAASLARPPWSRSSLY
jgi:hypothetical protein